MHWKWLPFTCNVFHTSAGVEGGRDGGRGTQNKCHKAAAISPLMHVNNRQPLTQGQDLVRSAIFRPQEGEGNSSLLFPQQILIMWLVLHAPADSFPPLLWWWWWWGGVGVELAALLCQTSFVSVRFSRICLCDGSRAHWGWAVRGGGECGVLTLELSQYMLSAFAANQSIHVRYGDPHPRWKEASEWLLWEVPFWSLRGFLRSRVSLVSLVSVIKLWLGDWLTGWGGD